MPKHAQCARFGGESRNSYCGILPVLQHEKFVLLSVEPPTTQSRLRNRYLLPNCAYCARLGCRLFTDFYLRAICP